MVAAGIVDGMVAGVTSGCVGDLVVAETSSTGLDTVDVETAVGCVTIVVEADLFAVIGGDIGGDVTIVEGDLALDLDAGLFKRKKQ